MLAAGLGGLIVPVVAQNGTAGSEDQGTSTGHMGWGMMGGGMISRGMMAGCSELMPSMHAASSGRSTPSWASFSPMPKPCSLPVSSAYRWTILRARPSPTPSIHNKEPITMDDVIIIGGSFAGLAGALQLGRARRKVTVLDTGLPRNRFAGHSHGLLGHDHKPPLEILAEARQQLARYPTIRLVNARADSISGAIDDFSVLTNDGETLKARRLLLSYGIADQMPATPGFAECWGKSIVPCPYCDGFEVAGKHWGLVYAGPHSAHAVMLFQDWTDNLTLFADGHDIAP